MRSIIILLFVVFPFCAIAQKPVSKVFHLPKEATPGSYSPGVVLVKVKSDSKPLFENAGAGNRAVQVHPSIASVSPMLPFSSQESTRSRNQPGQKTSGIDLSEYFRVYFSGTDIEAFINELYATGTIDIAEPDYLHEMFYTPNDSDRVLQYYLDVIKAYEAWDISKSDESIIIAIIDSGGDLDHPDIASKLFINEAELNGLPGVDDDGNGFIDDIKGWDFSGAEARLINTPGFVGDNDPSIFSGGNHSHGTWAAGCAAAATDNEIGIAGVGFNAKLLFTKHYADDQLQDSRSYSSDLYQGILYAASMGAKVINCSFGSAFRSQIRQNIITAVTLDYGSLVVAAAGNADNEVMSYPASFDYVLSVAASNASDVKTQFSTYNFKVDISAPGNGIYTTSYDDTYFTVEGTSFAAPIVSGAAALLWTHFPDYTPMQIAQQLRVTADGGIYAKNSVSYKNRLGKGRLDILKALTTESPSIRASSPRLVNENGTVAIPGQKGLLSLDFQNILKPSSSALKVVLESSNPLVTVLKNTVQLGVLATDQIINNANDPFELELNPAMPSNFTVDFTLTFTDGDYTDFEVVQITFNPTYLNIEENLISSTLSAGGRIGFEDPSNQSNGLGFVFNENQMLYEMGLVMGTSQSLIQSNIRGASSGVFDQDFTIVDKINEIRPGVRSSAEVFGKIRTTTGLPMLEIAFRSLVWGSVPDENYFILEYVIRNTGTNNLENFYFGIFADWDVSENGANDKASFFSDTNDQVQIGFVYPAVDQNKSKGVAGIQSLSKPDKSNHYAIENSPDVAVPLGSFGLYDGFLKMEKYTSLSTRRNRAGVSEANGTDVSHVVSSGPYSIPAGGEIIVAFSLHAANDSIELIQSARRANIVYNKTLVAPKPIIGDTEVCYGDAAEIRITGTSKYFWYTTFTGGEPIHEGNTLSLPPLFNDTVLYVSNADSVFESVRTPAKVFVRANPHITSSGSTTICAGQSVTLSVAPSDTYLWSTGATTREIEVSAAGDYSVVVRHTTLGCESTSSPIHVDLIPSPTADFTNGELVSKRAVSFQDKSQGAIAWLWGFGDGGTSTLQNPTYLYRLGGDIVVTLTVTAANGCSSSISKALNVVTSIVQNQLKVLIYPNPVSTDRIFIESENVFVGPVRVELVSLLGKILETKTMLPTSQKHSYQLDISTVPSGLYFIVLTDQKGNRSTNKLIVSH